MPRQQRKPRPRVKGVSIRVEHREQVDWDRYAYALLQHVKNEMAAEAKKKQPKDRGSS